MIRAIVIAPGRGSYGKEELGTLARAKAERPESADLLAALESARGAPPSLAELDASPSFSPRLHLAPENASDLIFAASALDFALVEQAGRAVEVVAVVGMSLGFYTALHVSGALSLADAARLVGTMGRLQAERGVEGGQLVYPVSDEETWRPSLERESAVAAALESAEGHAHRSIRFGGYDVLAGDDAGLAALERALPPETRRGGRRYPLRLAGHSAFHTPLMAELAREARARLADLPFRAPRTPLVDGRGAIFRPRISSPEDLFRYTLGVQPVEPFDFTTAVRVALREYAPELVIALGPGDTLGGPLGQILVREGWAGIRDRASFQDRQGAELPLILGLGRLPDRARLRALAKLP